MALSYKRTMVHPDDVVKTPEDVSEQLFEMADASTPLLKLVGLDSLSKPCTSQTHIYLEQARKVARTTLNGAISNSDTTIVFDEAEFGAGARVRINEEVILLGSTSDNLTFTGCTRSVGTAAAAAQADADIAELVGKPHISGLAGGSTSDLLVYPSEVTTYTRIFHRDIVVSDSANVLARYGRSESSEVDFAFNMQARDLNKEVENSMWWDVATNPTSSAGGAFSGIFERLLAASRYADKGGAAMTFDDLAAKVEAIRDYDPSYTNLALFVSPYQKRVFNGLADAHAMFDGDSDVGRLFGQEVDALKVSGAKVMLIDKPGFGPSAGLVSLNQLGLGPLVGPGGSRSFVREMYARDGSRQKGAVEGEYTFECANPEAHYMWASVKYA